MMETIVPVRIISWDLTFPVAKEIAFGGVLTGRLIPRAAEKATVTAASCGDHTVIATAIGISRLAAEVLLMKMEMIQVINPKAKVSTTSCKDSKGTRLTMAVDKPVRSIPTPRERPPATKTRTSQSIRLRS